MKIASWNVNGLRSVATKGFADWLGASGLDAVCLQEIKARPEQLDESIARPPGYSSVFWPAEKPGYSGVAIFSRKAPLETWTGVGDDEADREGRFLAAEFKDFVLISAYFPNSQRDHARLPFKLRFCERATTKLESLRALGKNVMICGDFNVAHREIDLKNPKSNVKNAGFLPEERAWMGGFLDRGWVDGFRKFEEGPGHYTWWSYRPGVREKNVGWRLDYACVNAEFSDRLKSVRHAPDVKGSDHCPVIAELKT